jgi:hypothetical protein
MVPSSFEDLLEQYRIRGLDPYRKKIPTSTAEREAATLSPTGDMYDGLALCLDSVLLEITAVNLADMTPDALSSLAAHAYIVGYSRVNLNISETCPNLVPIMRACQKLGDYFRCAARLWGSITESKKSRHRFAKFDVVQVSPPAPDKKEVDPNYWQVLECVWWRRKGTFMPMTRGHFLAKYQRSINKYGQWPVQEFVPPAKITLITALVDKYRRSPTIIGVSKDCCGLCTPFIQGVNDAQTGNLQWTLSGSHGNHYNVALPNVKDTTLLAGVEALKEHIYDRVIELIEGCVPDYRSETPPYWSSSESDSGDQPPSPFASGLQVMRRRRSGSS